MKKDKIFTEKKFPRPQVVPENKLQRPTVLDFYAQMRLGENRSFQ
jgi:hypothetical protein